MNIFANVSNHPSSRWSDEQRAAAQSADILDIAFPSVPSAATTDEVEALADGVAAMIPDGATAMVQGEMTLTACLVRKLQARGIRTVAATSERVVTETVEPDGSIRKVATFRFVQFREYPSLI